MTHYLKDEDITYIDNQYTRRNVFSQKGQETVDIPDFNEVKEKLPEIVWDGHESAVRCYYKAWELLWENIHNPLCPALVSPFVDAAFNDCIFMWDSCFMLMFGKYADRYFPFQKTLDNFYALQHRDGFIGREISEKDGSEKFSRHDPSSTGPNILAWCEYEYYKFTGDKERLSRVFDPLLAYHQWFRNNRTWKDGSYFSSGWGCGMDNMPRLRGNDDKWFSHNHMTWCDTCMQQLLNCKILIKIADILKRDDIDDIIEEQQRLSLWVNENLWDNTTKYYYDLWNNNELNMIKSVGAYWSLLAKAVPQDRKDDFIKHLKNPHEFMRPNCVPTLSADCRYYSKKGKLLVRFRMGTYKLYGFKGIGS